MANHLALFSTTNSLEEAKKIATYLVEHRLAACVNIVPGITSIYRWKNAVSEDQEFLLVMKTTSDNVEKIKEAILNLHSYETPELIGFDVTHGLPDYLNWIDASTTGEES
jgi:periplasmic divalent cation tolerance protein